MTSNAALDGRGAKDGDRGAEVRRDLTMDLLAKQVRNLPTPEPRKSILNVVSHFYSKSADYASCEIVLVANDSEITFTWQRA